MWILYEGRGVSRSSTNIGFALRKHLAVFTFSDLNTEKKINRKVDTLICGGIAGIRNKKI